MRRSGRRGDRRPGFRQPRPRAGSVRAHRTHVPRHARTAGRGQGQSGQAADSQPRGRVSRRAPPWRTWSRTSFAWGRANRKQGGASVSWPPRACGWRFSPWRGRSSAGQGEGLSVPRYRRRRLRPEPLRAVRPCLFRGLRDPVLHRQAQAAQPASGGGADLCGPPGGDERLGPLPTSSPISRPTWSLVGLESQMPGRSMHAGELLPGLRRGRAGLGSSRAVAVQGAKDETVRRGPDQPDSRRGHRAAAGIAGGPVSRRRPPEAADCRRVHPRHLRVPGSAARPQDRQSVDRRGARRAAIRPRPTSTGSSSTRSWTSSTPWSRSSNARR